MQIQVTFLQRDYYGEVVQQGRDIGPPMFVDALPQIGHLVTLPSPMIDDIAELFPMVAGQSSFVVVAVEHRWNMPSGIECGVYVSEESRRWKKRAEAEGR